MDVAEAAEETADAVTAPAEAVEEADTIAAEPEGVEEVQRPVGM